MEEDFKSFIWDKKIFKSKARILEIAATCVMME